MPAEQLLSFGPYRFALDGEQVWRGRHAVKLTPKALVLLRTLVTRAGEVVTKNELLQVGWPQTVVSDDALTACIQELRRALGDDARQPRYIETIHRRGFRFIGKVVSLEPPVARRKEPASIEGQGSTQLPPIPDNGHPAPPLVGRERELAQLQAWSDILRGGWRGGALSLAGLAIIIGTIVLVQKISLKSPRTPASIPPPQRAAVALSDRPSIAVLPFINMSGDREQEYFSDGITDDLITDLSRLQGLFVIARDSSFTYKGKPAKLQDVGKELGVRYVLEGSVRKAAGKVRITVQLADASTGAEMWAERYDRPLGDVFALQDEIVRRIVTTLNLQIDLSQQGVGLRPRRTENLEAYDDMLRGTANYVRLTQDGNLKARQLLERAIVLDPKYADAYTALAHNYYLGWLSAFVPGSALEQAVHFAQQACALDDSQALPHGVLAFIYMWEGQTDRAFTEAQRVIARDPNSAFGYQALAEVLNTQERPREALAAVDKAIRLDPRNKVIYLWTRGWSNSMLGRWEEAFSDLKNYLARYPDFILAHAFLAAAYFNLGDRNAALLENAQVERIIALTPNSAVGYWALSIALELQGKPIEALAAVKKGLSIDPQNRVMHDRQLLFLLSGLYHELGRWEESLAVEKRYVLFFPDDIWAHALRGCDYAALGQIDAAKDEGAKAQRIFELFPQPAHHQLALALALIAQGKPAEALVAVEKVIRLDPGNRVLYLWTLGHIYALLGRWAEAISALTSFLARFPYQVRPRLELARAYIEAGRDRAAQAEVAEALRFEPQLSMKIGVPCELPMDTDRCAADLRRAGLK
jgi:TolB-like protein/DNA-binding winged helix-turn-helix (wHTH) protein/predicted Zn-dependent protease